MTSISRLEEEIARTTDPTVRQQLQELLEMRQKKRANLVRAIIGVAVVVFVAHILMTLLKLLLVHYGVLPPTIWDK